MISNAKGRHVSPGVYTEEKDVVFSVKSLGITSLGLVGETLYGPAFENIEISEWNDFVDYFGGTSSELYKGNGRPKYELPYIAKSYLTKSKNLNVVRVLGFSGYDAGKCWVVKSTEGDDESTEKPLIILRSKKIMGENGGGICGSNDGYEEIVSSITITKYNNTTYTTFCDGGTKPYDAPLNVDRKLCIKVTTKDNDVEYYNVSLDPRDGDYIYKVISSNPQDNKKSSIYVEAVYEDSLPEVVVDGNVRYTSDLPAASANTNNIYNVERESSGSSVTNKKYESDGENWNEKNIRSIKFGDATVIETTDYSNYKGKYRCALTPWIVSEANSFVDGSNCPSISLKRLFRFLTISDGDVSNYQIKVSIEKIDPFKGTFDVVVRDFNDVDSNISVLEKFTRCSMKKGDASFIGYKIGTSDGLYGNKSRYITVELYGDEDLSGSVPCGFLGYPTPSYGASSANTPQVKYNTEYNPRIKEKKQYFGISNVDTDVLSFKGTEFYEDDEMTQHLDNNGKWIISPNLVYTKGFHLDSIFANGCDNNVYIDGVKELYDSASTFSNQPKYTFDCVSTGKVSSDQYQPRITSARFEGNSSYINETIYKNENLRKFTVCFYGGFDGWDINRKERTNTDDYNVNNYGTTSAGYETFRDAVDYKLPSYVNTSDYYAYLAGYKVLSNPQDVDINVFATPGIDWYNNTMLTKEAIEVIEDPEDGRGGDALYIMNSPYEIQDPVELAMEFEGTDINSSYACTYAPWILYKDTVRNEYLYLPPTKDVIRNIAETDNTSFPWFAPAGTTRGVVDCEKAAYKTTLDDEDTLYENRINPIKTFGKDGVIVWGNKTAYDVESPINRINVRRLMIRVKKLITSAAKHLIFEQYDDAIEKQFRGLVEPILADVKSNRGIYDYRIKTEVTPETRDQHILPAKIMIKPTPALEYISITFVVYPESVAFEGE